MTAKTDKPTDRPTYHRKVTLSTKVTFRKEAVKVEVARVLNSIYKAKINIFRFMFMFVRQMILIYRYLPSVY